MQTTLRIEYSNDQCKNACYKYLKQVKSHLENSLKYKEATVVSITQEDVILQCPSNMTTQCEAIVKQYMWESRLLIKVKQHKLGNALSDDTLKKLQTLFNVKL